ncbi:MAG: DUF2723 domain-containing protein, partial [Gemmatimonadales bacterium]|nr:DUF2723 domain-containing protein [Gemmatimonadales bacterium]
MSDTPAERPPYLWAVATFLVVFVVYLLTLSPTTAFWDTSEYIAAAKVLGIPHPPGNPLFTLMAHAWGLLPLAAEYSVRINLFAAITSAAGAGLWFLVAERWLRPILPTARGPRIASAFAGVFASAMAWTVWNQSTVNEKVYTVSLLSIALLVWSMVRWADLPDGPRRNGMLIAAAYIGALSSTNHMMGVLAIPIIALYVLWTKPRLALEPWVMLMGWVLVLGVFGILGDSLTVLTAKLSGPPGMTGNFSNPATALTLTNTVDGASDKLAALRIGGLLGIVGLLGFGMQRDKRNPLLYIGALAVIVGLSVNYIYLPIRAGQLPPINEGEPTGFFSQGLSDVINRIQYGKGSVFKRQATFSSQLNMYWTYWSWQWGRDLGGLRSLAVGLFSVLTLGGAAALWRRDKRAGTAAAALLVTFTLALIFYLNFKYGYSFQVNNAAITQEMREVRERDYFYVVSFAFVGVLIAAGLAATIRYIGETLGDRVSDSRRWLVGTPVLLLGLVPFFGNRVSASRAHETLARDFAIDILESVEPYGILITAGDNDTFPLWFAQEVLGIRRDVTLANLSLMNTDWHLRQIRRRETPTFDPATAAALWRPRSDADTVPLGAPAAANWVKPTNTVFAMTTQGLD